MDNEGNIALSAGDDLGISMQSRRKSKKYF